MRSSRPSMRVLGLVGLLLGLVLAGCAGPDRPDAADAADALDESVSASPDEPERDATTGHTGDHDTDASGARPLRPGEEHLTLAMAQEYTPSAPTGVGTDDYRCFLLDPELTEDRFLTGTDVRPGNPDVVHHVILFQVPPDAVPAAERLDAESEDPGWTCFGDMGVETGPMLDDAPWLAAWAPGGGETVQPRGYGVRLDAGARVVMQVHYNLLAGNEPDRSAARLRLAAPEASVEEVSTMLLPAPVELPCRPGRDDGPLCEREAAVADVKARFGQGPGSAADLLHLLCATPVKPSPVSRCERTVQRPTTVMAAAGHMHLLGRSLSIEVEPEGGRPRTLLDIPVWNFDDQGARPVGPVRLEPGDQVRVTCRHSQRLRDVLPAFDESPERYVVWGEGTTDEMCLGILQVTYP